MRTDGPEKRERRARAPIDAAGLESLALAYAARFATTAAKLATYLSRKVDQRGTGDDDSPDVAMVIPGIVERLVALGYVNDAEYAESRGRGLRRRGYGARRIADTLGAAGVDRALATAAGGDEAEGRAAAFAFARRRRFGPFAAGDPGPEDRLDPAIRRKQVAAFIRAGHPLATALALIDARSIDDAEAWLTAEERE